MIKAIVFDYGGILGKDNHLGHAKVISERHDINADEFMKFSNNLTHEKHDMGYCTTEEFVKELANHFNVPMTLDDYDKDTAEIFGPTNNELWDLFPKLKGKYILGILSNNNPHLIAMYKKQHPQIDSLFDFQIYSCEIHIRKPNKKIYELMIEKAGCKPEEIVFIDDKEHNLTVPKAMGVNTILFKNVEQILDELKGLNVKF